MEPVAGDDMVVRIARMRWRAAEDRLYPALLADPTSYQQTMTAVQAVVAEVRRRCHDLERGDPAGLLAAEAAAFEVVAVACPGGVPVPPELLVSVACSAVDRELTAWHEQRRRAAVLEAARAAGQAWATVDGPATAEELTEGRMVMVHLVSETVVMATVDPWARKDSYAVEVTPDGTSGTFDDRETWLAELSAVRTRVEAGLPASPGEDVS